jgi:hypothetical protein
MEAKEHVPNEFHEHHATGHPHARDTEAAQPEGKKHAGEEAGDES